MPITLATTSLSAIYPLVNGELNVSKFQSTREPTEKLVWICPNPRVDFYSFF